MLLASKNLACKTDYLGFSHVDIIIVDLQPEFTFFKF